jgi:hypothetical protein
LPLPYIVFLRRITIKKCEKKKKGGTFLFVAAASAADFSLSYVPVNVLVTIQVRLCPGLGDVVALHSGEKTAV